MASASKTPNLNLPQWVATEKPERTDFNGAFNTIDGKLISANVSSQFSFADGYSGQIVAYRRGDIIFASFAIIKTGGWTVGTFSPFASFIPSLMANYAFGGFIGGSTSTGTPVRCVVTGVDITVMCPEATSHTIRMNAQYIAAS